MNDDAYSTVDTKTSWRQMSWVHILKECVYIAYKHLLTDSRRYKSGQWEVSIAQGTIEKLDTRMKHSPFQSTILSYLEQ